MVKILCYVYFTTIKYFKNNKILSTVKINKMRERKKVNKKE